MALTMNPHEPSTPLADRASAGVRARSLTTALTRPTPALLRTVAAVAMLLAAVGYLAAELTTATAWTNPRYDWLRNLVPDLANTGVGPNHQGQFVSSPLHALMNTAIAAQGLLFAAAILLLAAPLTGRLQRTLQALAGTQALALGAVAVFTHSPTASTATLTANIVSAAIAMLASNAIIVTAGIHRRRLMLPRWIAVAGVTLGTAATLAGVGLTLLPVPAGLSERVSIYPYLLWQVLCGTALLWPRRAQPVLGRRSAQT